MTVATHVHVVKTVLVAASALAVLAAPAPAEIRLFDPVAGTERVVVRDDAQDLLGVSDDGAALFVRRGRDVLSVSTADGAATVAPQFADAETIGPGGRWAGDGEIHAPDGRIVATYDVSPLDAGEPPRLAWSRDGTRVAVLSAEHPLDTDQKLLVFDTATGTVLARRSGIEDLAPQAFAPDGNALLVVTRRDVLGVAVPGGAALGRQPLTSLYGHVAVWGPSGAIAIAQRHRIDVSNGADIGVENASTIAWSGDGQFLAYRYETPRTACSYPRDGLIAAVPGGPSRDVLAPGDGQLKAFMWAPASALLAVDLVPSPTTPRGTRHPWPKRVATDYAASRAGDRALRNIVLRVARSLRRGADPEDVLARAREDYRTAVEHHRETGARPVRAKLADEINHWLHAAGWPRLRSAAELSC